MFAGLIALAFNPSAWIAVGLTALVAFSGGVVKGWNASNADHWKTQAIAIELASKQKDEIIASDAMRAAADQDELTKRDKFIEDMVHATPASSCRFDRDELSQLQQLAAGGRQHMAPVPGDAKRHKAGSKP